MSLPRSRSSFSTRSLVKATMVRFLLVGYCYGIRSERRLCEEVHLNLAYCWFCRLGLGGEVPDHSTFSKNRHGRFRDCDLLRKLFETAVRRCMAEGLVDGAAFAVDASPIAADANKQRSAAGSDDVDWKAIARTRRSVREYLDTLDEATWGGASETIPKFISKSDPAAHCSIGPANVTATSASLSRVAVPRCPLARSHVQFTRTPETSRATSPRLRPT
jgi:transposase